ncbi:MAG TPA: class I SAM-dependent methyltransferase [Planctomycetota bacterium]|nr:class I SAM-dependent methyltransferase [Planctomycetota bacterium]
MSQENAKQLAQQVWGATPAGSAHAPEFQPGTRDFFERVIAKRSTEELPFLYEVVPFASFAGKRVLELGCGAGYDAYEICRNKAVYTGIDLTPQNIERTRKHLELFGYTPTVQHGDAENLTFGDAQFDIIFSNGVLHHTPDMEKSFREACRVTKPGGEFWVILYHKHSIFYWLSMFLWDHILCRGYKERTFAERMSMIEGSTSGKFPLVNVYSRSSAAKILRNAGWTPKQSWVRKLTPADLPCIPHVSRFWWHIPQSLLNFVGKGFGWYLIFRATKEAK